MALSEMTKNDFAAIDHMLRGSPDSICGACGVRVDPNRCQWSTCTPVDKMYTCKLCVQDEEARRFKQGYCTQCGTNSAMKGFRICSYCSVKNQPSVLPPPTDHYDGSLLSKSTWERLRAYRNRYLYMEFVRDKPGVTIRYVGPIVDKKICEYCKEEDDGRHSPVALLWRFGTRYSFCNPYRKDYDNCFSKWKTENDMWCPIKYYGVQCQDPKGHEIPHPNKYHSYRLKSGKWKYIWDKRYPKAIDMGDD